MLNKITHNLYVELDSINWLVLDKEKDICRFTYKNGACYECKYFDGKKIIKYLNEYYVNSYKEVHEEID